MRDTLQVISRLIQAPDYLLDLRMPLFAKARPRLTKTGIAYMPQVYKDSQAEMKRQILEQWQDDGAQRARLSGPIAVYVKMFGEARVDGDNAIGACLDVGGPVKSKGLPGILWEDDTVSVIPLMIAAWERASKEDSRWLIHILKLDS